MNVVFGQEDTTDRKFGTISYREEAIDSSLRIIDYDKVNFHPCHAHFINGKFYPMSISVAPSLDKMPEGSVAINVSKGDTVINGELYIGKIFITTSDTFEIKAISLSNIKKKYTDLKEQSVVFIIDGEIITRDYDTYLIDENSLYTVSFGKIQKQDIVFVDIVTKTEENIKKRNGFFVGVRWKK
jgi:archaellum component FlaG (FlaF/FlaG flagellin family)